MYRHVYNEKCLFKHPLVAVRAPHVTKLSMAKIAIMVLGQLRTTQYAQRLRMAYPGTTKHIYASIERLNSKSNTYVSVDDYKKWVKTLKPDWITEVEYTQTNLNCSNITDSSRHWPQYGRMYDTFEAIRQHEILGEYRYEWIVRLRCDLLNTPSLSLRFDALVDAVHINGVWHNWGKDRKPHQYLTRDYYFVVPRLKADSFFSIGLDFLTCQSLKLNMKICEVSKWVLFPECILKTHLKVCNISFKIF